MGTEEGVLNSQVVPISQVVLITVSLYLLLESPSPKFHSLSL